MIVCEEREIKINKNTCVATGTKNLKGCFPRVLLSLFVSIDGLAWYLKIFSYEIVGELKRER